MQHTINRISLLLVLTFQCKMTFAQAPSPQSGVYAHDLGGVIAEIRGAQTIVDICAEQFPDLKSTNQLAVDNWRDRYKPFVAEMNSRFDALPKYWASKHLQGAKSTPAYWVTFLDNQISAARDVVKRQFQSTQPEQKRLICTGFPQALTSERWNLESFHKDMVANIRRGPG
jgi:hypothetical protein